jgi:predicted enzyme related to lactoylglutathione lyase
VKEDIVADKVVHFELPADNLERAQHFYRNAFDWSINTVPGMGYLPPISRIARATS